MFSFAPTGSSADKAICQGGYQRTLVVWWEADRRSIEGETAEERRKQAVRWCYEVGPVADLLEDIVQLELSKILTIHWQMPKWFA